MTTPMTKFTNPVGGGSESDDDAAAEMFDSEPKLSSPAPRNTSAVFATFDAEKSDREAVAESLVHMGADEIGAFAAAPPAPHVLCEGRVQCQFRGKKGPFTALRLTLESDGTLTLRTIAALPGREAKSQGTVVRCTSALWCSVRNPKTVRKQYPSAIRVNLAPDSAGQREKLILAVEAEDAEDELSSGMTLDALKAALYSCSYAKLGATGLKLETDKERRMREAAEDMSASGVVLNPESTFRRRWDMIQLLLLIYVAIAVPFRVGFSVKLDLWTFWFFFDVSTDIYFISDIFVSFQTAYYDERGELETKVDRIFSNYFRTWFPVDALACFPGQLISYASGDGTSKAAALLNLSVMLKLLRLARLGRLIARYEVEFHFLINQLKLGKLVLLMGFLGHWLCCLWFAIGSLESNALDQYGDPVLGWVSRMWGQDESSLSTATTMDRYLRSFYWAIMTMTTVGYGDIIPNTGWETVIAVIGMIIGGFVFALVVGSLSELSKRSNPGDLVREEKYGLVAAMLHQGAAKSVDPALARRIRAYWSNYYQKRTAMDFLNFIKGCPPDLRDELAYQLHWIDGGERGKTEAGLLAKIPFFTGLDSLSSIYICSKMRSITALPVTAEADGSRSNLIMVEGTRAEEMYIIIEVEVEAEGGKSIVLEKDGAELGRLGFGDFFGELAALLPATMKRHRTRTRTAYATSQTHLGMLTHDDLLQLCAERSEIADVVVPYVNAIAASLPPVVVADDKRDSSQSQSQSKLSQQDKDEGAEQEVPSGPVLSEYDIHPVLKAIQPTLSDFDTRLKAIDEKLDKLLLAAK